MRNIDFFSKRDICKDIENANKRHVGEITDAWLGKVLIYFLLIMIPSGIDIIILDTMTIGLFFPFFLLSGAIGLCLNEFRVYLRDKKTDKNLDKIVKSLKEYDVNVSAEQLAKSVVLEDVKFNNNSNSNTEEINNSCYIFKNNKEVYGLCEDYNGPINQYYLLNKGEIEEIIDSSPKVRRLIRKEK